MTESHVPKTTYSYTDAYLDRSNVFNSIRLAQRTVERISRYKPIIQDINKKQDLKTKLINELTAAQEILKKHFLLVWYERRYVDISELEKLHKQIIKGDEMLKALQSPVTELPQTVATTYKYNKHKHFKIISSMNDKRLTAVWFRLMLPELLNSCHSMDPEAKLAVPNEVAGVFSFSLYGVRDIYEILHILNISYGTLSKEEKRQLEEAINAQTERKIWRPFWTHLWESKYLLTNDTLWGVDNALEYFKEYYPSILGGVGAPIGMGLFGMDFILQLCRAREEIAKHAERIIQINQIGDENIKKRELDEEMLQWKYQEHKLAYDCLYALTVCIGFAMFCLCPPVLVGATLLVGTTFVYNVFGLKGLQLSEEYERKLLIKQNINNDITTFQAKHVNQDQKLKLCSENISPEIKMLCIDILANKQKLIEQDNIIAKRQRAQQVTAILNILIPVLSFTCICLLPTGVGFAATLGMILVIYALKTYVYDKIIEAEQKELKDKAQTTQTNLGIILDNTGEFDVKNITIEKVLTSPDSAKH